MQYKPSWVAKKDFYRLPFNYCDRWCEKCQLTEVCKVYEEGQKDRAEAIKQGKDPDSMEFAFEVTFKNFQETIKLLYESAEKWGIDLQKIEEEAKDEDIYKTPEYETNPLFILTEKFSCKLLDLLRNLENIPVIGIDLPQLQEDIDVISFYRTTIIAKMGRALSSEERERGYPEDLITLDDKTSAFIVYNILGNIRESLVNISKQKGLRLVKRRCLKLSLVAVNLQEQIYEYFEFANSSTWKVKIL